MEMFSAWCNNTSSILAPRYCTPRFSVCCDPTILNTWCHPTVPEDCCSSHHCLITQPSGSEKEKAGCTHFLFNIMPRNCSHDFCSHAIGHKLITWPLLTARETGKCRVYASSKINIGDN